MVAKINIVIRREYPAINANPPCCDNIISTKLECKLAVSALRWQPKKKKIKSRCPRQIAAKVSMRGHIIEMESSR